jgi:hypothetical protein
VNSANIYKVCIRIKVNINGIHTIMRKTKTITITTSPELDEEVSEMIDYLNKTKLDGTINKSRIIRIALVEWLDRQKKIQRILNEHSDINKTAEDLLRENGYC